MSASRLESLAYRMLGSVADAEDVVQEAHLRLLKQPAPPENEEAWLFRVVTNLSLDRLREEKRRRENYPGPWLPDPLPTGRPDDIAELAEDLSMGLLFVLERLSPVERAVFILREGFDMGFEDIGAVLASNAASCRQRYHRARSHLTAEPDKPRQFQDAEAQQSMLEALLGAVAERDLDSLVALFARDCVAYTDGGGVVSAAIIPITDPSRIARVTLHLAQKMSTEGKIEFHWRSLNASVGLLITVAGKLEATLQLDVADGAISRIYIVRNPQKLAHLSSLLK